MPSRKSISIEDIPEDVKELKALILKKGADHFIEFPPIPPQYFAIKDQFDNKEISFVVCPFCKNNRYNTLPGFKYHVNGKCPEAPKQHHTCLICQNKFCSHSEVKLHIQGNFDVSLLNMTNKYFLILTKITSINFYVESYRFCQSY